MTATALDTNNLQFFGKVSASVSHEIKNVFAVINEAAGLVEDFTLMAERGMPIEPERLKRVANSIQGQIQRGDAIVKNMNALAHSTDEVTQTVDLVQTLTLTVGLATRMADMKQMKLELGECDAASVEVNPFALIHIIYGNVASALEAMAPNATLMIATETDSENVTITFRVPDQGINLKPDNALSGMAKDLAITMAENTQNGGLDLTLKRAD